MNVDDLSWQVGNYGGLPPRKVDLLLERGHLDLVIQAAEERAEWFCAERAAQELCLRGAFGRAIEVVEPFAALGWRPALWAKANVLLRAGRTGEALDLVRPDEEGRTSEYVCRDFAELLVRAGHVDEAIDLLVPHLGGGWIRSVLVEITEGQGRDERVLELIAPHAETARQALEKSRRASNGEGVLVLQARLLERMHRADEAIRVLGTDIAATRYGTQNTLTAYAELLSRHGRLDVLRELATGEHAHTVLDIFAGALRDCGRADEAETVMREAIAADDWVGYRAWLSVTLLHDGRLDDAIAVAEPRPSPRQSPTAQYRRPPRASRGGTAGTGYRHSTRGSVRGPRQARTSGRGGLRPPRRHRAACRKGEDRIRPSTGGRVLRGTSLLGDALRTIFPAGSRWYGAPPRIPASAGGRWRGRSTGCSGPPRRRPMRSAMSNPARPGR
ncbi:lipopolysaccharide assembly protein LapB [Streptomyces sp. WAC06614]|uniref:tetratricopeptide repeat protein n=1 Tax=Streptomyces sp. WAC06614 TaxID=2487416 RepID=UPI0021AFFB79|nr:hypothetical protein [Streptomyces sp. WAC06614]